MNPKLSEPYHQKGNILVIQPELKTKHEMAVWTSQNTIHCLCYQDSIIKMRNRDILLEEEQEQEEHRKEQEQEKQ